MKIVSLVPSQSELIWDLGAGAQLAGITKFCIHPAEMFQTVKRVGGTKTLDLAAIRAIQPDIIIANKEENEKNQIEALQKEFNVYVSDINTLDDALEMIAHVGKLVGQEKNAGAMIAQIKKSFDKMPAPSARKVIYLMWNKPYMAAGTKTFIHEMIKAAGLQNVIRKERYPEINVEEIKNLQPDLILLSSEPFPFNTSHAKDLIHKTGIETRLVDGEIFSWYGSRLLKAPAYFTSVF